MQRRLYQALISKPGSDRIDARVQFAAEDSDAAKAELEAEYGDGAVFSIWSVVDAAKPR